MREQLDVRSYVIRRLRLVVAAVVIAASVTSLGGVGGESALEQLSGAVPGGWMATEVVWIDEAPDSDGPLDSFRLRRIAFSAAPTGEDGAPGPRDVFTALVRVLPNGRLAAVHAVRNVTRSPEADEGDLVVGPDSVAFPVRWGERTIAAGVASFPSGRRESEVEDGWMDVLRAGVRDWIRDGRPQGIERFRVVLPASAGDVSLRFDGPRLRIDSTGRTVAALDIGSGALDCPSRGCALETGARGLLGWFPWAADVARSISWIGPERVAELEDMVLVAADRWRSLAASLLGADGSADASEASMRATEVPPPVRPPGPDIREAPRCPWPPEPIETVVAPALEGEGEWRAFDEALVGRGPDGPVLLTAFFRPDPSRAAFASVIVTLWDPRSVDIGLVPGTLDPPAADGTLPAGRVPRDVAFLPRLLAGFSGGYQAVNGQFGEVVDRRVFVPLQPWAASIVRFDDGSVGLGTWPPGLPDVPVGIATVRQNLSPLVEDGEFNPYGRKAWGGLAPTVPSHGRDEDFVPTVRSAICTTSDGLVAHLWGTSLTVRTLASAATRARCTYAVALDMNPDNAIVELYRVGDRSLRAELPPISVGESSGDLEPTGLWFRAHLLLPDMADDPGRFLIASERDFFYLSLREEPLGESPPEESDVWVDEAGNERPVFRAERFSSRRVFPDVAPVPPTTWWPAQRDTLPRDYVRRIQQLWEQKAGRGSGAGRRGPDERVPGGGLERSD